MTQERTDHTTPRPAMRLDYATPMPRRWRRVNALLWLGVRKLVFASGIWLFCYGAISVPTYYYRAKDPLTAACGAALAALMLPFPFRSPSDDPRGSGGRRASCERCGI
jgi:hypothetical protein